MTPKLQKAVMVGVIIFLVTAALALFFVLTRVPPIMRYTLAIADLIMAGLVFVSLRQHNRR